MHVQKFRANLTKNIFGIIIAILAFLTGIITGLYEIIEGEVFFEVQNKVFGGVMVILGIFLPFFITTILLNWDKEQNLDLSVVLFTLILNVLLIAIYIYLPIVIFILIQSTVYAILTIGVGISSLLGSVKLIKLIPKRNNKWRLGGFLLVMGNHLFFLGTYCLIGGILT
ncbi:MAG: hypothetical protein ACTSYI_12305 [Promethearchaeota archaeon]